jgi:hypothetical protein
MHRAMGKINTKFGELKINRIAFWPGARTEITSGYFGKTTLDEDILLVAGLRPVGPPLHLPEHVFVYQRLSRAMQRTRCDQLSVRKRGVPR